MQLWPASFYLQYVDVLQSLDVSFVYWLLGEVPFRHECPRASGAGAGCKPRSGLCSRGVDSSSLISEDIAKYCEVVSADF